MALTVRPISAEEHLGLLASRSSASFLQCPSWGQVKREWRSESIGWYDEQGTLVGAGLVLYRQVPKLAKYLAYLPEGPVIDWARRRPRGLAGRRWSRTSRRRAPSA